MTGNATDLFTARIQGELLMAKIAINIQFRFFLFFVKKKKKKKRSYFTIKR